MGSLWTEYRLLHYYAVTYIHTSIHNICNSSSRTSSVIPPYHLSYQPLLPDGRANGSEEKENRKPKDPKLEWKKASLPSQIRSRVGGLPSATGIYLVNRSSVLFPFSFIR